MSYDEETAERLRRLLYTRPDVVEKKMFGGLCFLLNGYMVVGISKGELLIRVGPEQHEKVMRMKHVRPMDFTKKPMKGFAFVGPKGFDSDAALARWVERCLRFVSTLPAK